MGAALLAQSRLQTKSESEREKIFGTKWKNREFNGRRGNSLSSSGVKFRSGNSMCIYITFPGSSRYAIATMPRGQNLNPPAPYVWILSRNGYDGEPGRQSRLEISPHLSEQSKEAFSAGGWTREQASHTDCNPVKVRKHFLGHVLLPPAHFDWAHLLLRELGAAPAALRLVPHLLLFFFCFTFQHIQIRRVRSSESFLLYKSQIKPDYML